jgi:hypothetical protein
MARCESYGAELLPRERLLIFRNSRHFPRAFKTLGLLPVNLRLQVAIIILEKNRFADPETRCGKSDGFVGSRRSTAQRQEVLVKGPVRVR